MVDETGLLGKTRYFPILRNKPYKERMGGFGSPDTTIYGVIV